MPGLFIVEGADATGKTTLAKKLAAHLRGAYWHSDGNKELFPCMTAYQQSVIENAKYYLLERDMDVVIDRHWPSEYVYSRVFKRPLFDHTKLQLQLRELGATYIYCMDEDSVERHEQNIDDAHPYDREQYLEIRKGYFELMMANVVNEHTVQYNLIRHGNSLPTFFKTHLGV